MKPEGDVLRKAEWIVANASIEKARVLVVRHHYAAGAPNTATFLHGLYRRSTLELCGVAWWLPPIRPAAVAHWPEDPNAVLALSRLVIATGTPKNAATFLLMRSVALIAPEWRCLVTYADTWQGHEGGIYKAAGWEYRGLSAPERTYVIDGRMVARKAGGHTRTHAEMLALGAECLGAFRKHRFRLVRPGPRRTAPEAISAQEFLFKLEKAPHDGGA